MTGVSGIASAIARKCAYKPSCVGLLYQGATCSTASAPASRARCEYSIAAAVELLPVPAITCARPRATSIVSAITRWSSASVIVALSPVVPHGTSRRTPPVIWRSTSIRIRSSSIAPSAVNGVTSAVAQPRIQSTFIVMIQTPYFYGTISEIRFVCSSVRSTMFIASSIFSQSSRGAKCKSAAPKGAKTNLEFPLDYKHFAPNGASFPECHQRRQKTRTHPSDQQSTSPRPEPRQRNPHDYGRHARSISDRPLNQSQADAFPGCNPRGSTRPAIHGLTLRQQSYEAEPLCPKARRVCV